MMGDDDANGKQPQGSPVGRNRERDDGDNAVEDDDADR